MIFQTSEKAQREHGVHSGYRHTTSQKGQSQASNHIRFTIRCFPRFKNMVLWTFLPRIFYSTGYLTFFMQRPFPWNKNQIPRQICGSCLSFVLIRGFAARHLKTVKSQQMAAHNQFAAGVLITVVKPLTVKCIHFNTSGIFPLS